MATKISKFPVIQKSVSGYSWRVNPIYRLVRLSKKQIRIDNDRTMLSAYAFKYDDGVITYENENRVPTYIKKQIARFYQLTNQHFD